MFTVAVKGLLLQLNLHCRLVSYGSCDVCILTTMEMSNLPRPTSTTSVFA